MTTGNSTETKIEYKEPEKTTTLIDDSRGNIVFRAVGEIDLLLDLLIRETNSGPSYSVPAYDAEDVKDIAKALSIRMKQLTFQVFEKAINNYCAVSKRKYRTVIKGGASMGEIISQTGNHFRKSGAIAFNVP